MKTTTPCCDTHPNPRRPSTCSRRDRRRQRAAAMSWRARSRPSPASSRTRASGAQRGATAARLGSRASSARTVARWVRDCGGGCCDDGCLVAIAFADDCVAAACSRFTACTPQQLLLLHYFQPKHLKPRQTTPTTSIDPQTPASAAEAEALSFADAWIQYAQDQLQEHGTDFAPTVHFLPSR